MTVKGAPQMAGYVALNGYIVVGEIDRTIAIVKAKYFPVPWSDKQQSEWIWLPQSAYNNGHVLDVGDTDISVRKNVAEERGLDWT